LAADGSFERKVVVVTGAAGGIGQALCLRFGRAGARIAALDRDAAGTDALAQALAKDGIEAAAHACDVTDPDQCRKAMRAVEERFGGVDLLINNAGITQRSRFVETELSVYQEVMAVNFFGSLYCTKAALDSLLARKGMIIVTSSIAGFTPLLGRSGYAASKHALHGLFETLRCELASQGVRVMIVCPGFTATNIEHNALDGSGRGLPRRVLGKAPARAIAGRASGAPAIATLAGRLRAGDVEALPDRARELIRGVSSHPRQAHRPRGARVAFRVGALARFRRERHEPRPKPSGICAGCPWPPERRPNPGGTSDSGLCLHGAPATRPPA
jgi:NAD(P)-dependent dehydrogenase (short-subunit alcohol dehydrogenase family)